MIVYLVEERSNPSTDFFVYPAASVLGDKVIRCGFADLPAPEALTGAMVVFVRYVPLDWMRLVEMVRPRLARLVFFMDDDLLDPLTFRGIPWRYRFKLWWLAASRAHWLQEQKIELWVSTGHLFKKYTNWGARLILPTPIPQCSDVRRFFYHGSASHHYEIQWLRPVVEEVLSREQRAVFEIVGDKEVRRLYKGLPGVIVVHPMQWPAYQAFLSTHERHVGLNPLVKGRFNQARSYTKFLDITRCGAVGIYSSGTACADVVSPGVDGLIVEMKEDVWVEAILRLLQDDTLRKTLLLNAHQKLISLGRAADDARRKLIN
ncbi:MAG: glycosyltransferase [Candidatus Omnitrophica bacterium]|nr:glycosyltransferase [Candidatus Omnitrophota bacterium]